MLSKKKMIDILLLGFMILFVIFCGMCLCCVIQKMSNTDDANHMYALTLPSTPSIDSEYAYYSIELDKSDKVHESYEYYSIESDMFDESYESYESYELYET